MGINYYHDRVCLNVLAGSLENAVEVYDAAEKHVVVGVLSSNYPTTEAAVEDMTRYFDALEGNLSVGLGAGNPNQWKVVGDIAKSIQANHFNQVFSAVGYTRANVNNESSHINALVSPTGKPGWVKISTGPLSSHAEDAIIPVATAIAMIKEMGGNSLKFFPMGGLKAKDELIAVSKACAEADFILEPTGGIDLDNFKEIMEIILGAGVKKTIPHVYTSIIDKASGCTRTEDVKYLMDIIKELV